MGARADLQAELSQKYTNKQALFIKSLCKLVLMSIGVKYAHLKFPSPYFSLHSTDLTSQIQNVFHYLFN